MIYLVTILFIAIAAIQIPGFVKQKLFKELVVYILIMGIALLYSYSGIAGWRLPAPHRLPELVFEPLSKLVFQRYYE